MSRLEELANELLLLIIQHLEAERDVSSLCRTSRHLYGVLNPTLYSRHVVRHNSWALCWAAEHDRVGTANLLIAASANLFVIFKQWDFLPPVLVAAKFGSLEMTKLLLKCGGEWEECPVVIAAALPDVSPLCLAARGDHVEVVKLYLSMPAATLSCNKLNRMPLGHAAEAGAVRVVDLLLRDDRFDPTARDIIRNQPLHDAAATKEDNSAVIQRLLDDPRVDISSADMSGSTPLHLAAIKGTSANIRVLLEAGADVNQRDRQGRTALSDAASFGHADSVATLLSDPRADPNVMDSLGYTPLIWAVVKRQGATAARLLRGERTIPHATTEFKDTALMVAVKTGFSDCVRHILSREDTDVNFDAKWGEFVLHEAICKGDLEIVRLLVEDERLDPRSMDEIGWTPMIYAAQYGAVEIIEMLYESGRFTIDETDIFGTTAMMHAARHGNGGVVKLLLRIADEVEGVEWDVEDHGGRTPVDRALLNGHRDIATLLCDYYGRSVPNTPAESVYSESSSEDEPGT